MLRVLHKKKVQKMIWIVLIVLIGPAFLFWGINSYQRNERDKEDNFGKLFGKKVTRQEYVDAKRASVLQLRMRFGESFDEVQKYFDYNEMALQRLALIKEAAKRGIRVRDAEVVKTIQSDPSFLNKAGRFDNSAYQSAMKYFMRIPARQYEEQVRQNLMIRKLSEEETRGVAVSDEEVREAYRKEHEQLDLEYIRAVPADFAQAVTVTDQELKDYFNAKSIDFKQPLSYNLDYVSTDKEHEVVAVNSRLEKESLEAVAKSMNLELKETGLFGEAEPIPGIGWSADLARLLPQAKPGQVFAPLLMEKKYYILRLKERKEPYVPEFETVKEKVRAVVVKERSNSLAKKKIEDCLTAIKSAQSKGTVDLAKEAKAAGLKEGSTGFFKFGAYIEGIGASEDFYTAGNALEDGEFSQVIETPSGLYILRRKAKQEIDEKKFADEKGATREKLLAEKQNEQFGKFVETLMKRALQ